jgi:spermidine synthase
MSDKPIVKEYTTNIYVVKEDNERHILQNATIKDSILTHRGTKVEMVDRPEWGIACYMDNLIQSATIDERIYHESLVHPAMLSVTERRRVMIIGGGEGATAREVLKWPGVFQVDMYEWDEDVVNLFKNKYSQWAKGAWDDPRLHIHAEDIFETIKTPPMVYNRYDVIIIDLFEPCEENYSQWVTLINSLHNWISIDGSIVMYAGMRYAEKPSPYKKVIDLINLRPVHVLRDLTFNKEIVPYKVYIPSFSGESVFLLLKNHFLAYNFKFEEAEKLNSHITMDVWNSYKTFNW